EQKLPRNYLASLERLYEAARAMTAELDVERLLERIVEHTRQHLGARYGALLVCQDDGQVPQFVTAGLDPDERERMGPLPEGRGLLGHVIEHGPLRLDNLAAHPASVGFPPGHPPMRSLLAVPIRLRDRTLGALFLTEKPGGFTADDEAILTAMAADAAVAIENGTLVKRLRDALHDLAEAQQRLAQAEALRAAGEMAAGVAHHINNALTVIQGRAELALSTVEDPRVRSTLEVVQQAARNAARIVRRMQELTSAPSARAVPLVDLSELARQAVALIQAQWRDLAGERDISIEVSTEAGQIPAVAGDPVSLTGMIENLLLNAVEATPDGGRIAVRTW
ncbi:MAG: GAF domain-containing protein, partial [candidate division NC10 bacterium]